MKRFEERETWEARDYCPGGGWPRASAAWIAAWMRAYPDLVAQLIARSGVKGCDSIRVLDSEGASEIYQAMVVAKALRRQRLVRKTCKIAERWKP